MNGVYDILAGNIPYPSLKQGDAPRSVILEKFRETTDSVLFATTSFWQGVDVVGESLSAVIVDKLPFASPGDPLVEARIEYINKKGGSALYRLSNATGRPLAKAGVGQIDPLEGGQGTAGGSGQKNRDERLWSSFYQKPPCHDTGQGA